MAISFPISIPSSPAIKSVKFKMVNASAFNSSPFTGQQQVTVFPGQWWEIEVTLPTMTRADAEEWISFLAKLNGHEGTFNIGDPDGATPRGTGGGTPLVNGASQTGQDLITDGWNLSEAVLKTGDYVQIGTKLYKSLTDVTSDGSGNATLTLYPSVKTAPSDGASIIVTNTTGTFRLKTPVSGWSADSLSHYTVSFSAVEAI